MKKEVAEGHAIYVGFEELAEKTESQHTSEVCPGKYVETDAVERIEPKAEPGYLCVYEGYIPGGPTFANLETRGETGTHNLRASGEMLAPGTQNLAFEAAGPTGALLDFRAKESSQPSEGNGVWAVTAE